MKISQAGNRSAIGEPARTESQERSFFENNHHAATQHAVINAITTKIIHASHIGVPCRFDIATVMNSMTMTLRIVAIVSSTKKGQ